MNAKRNAKIIAVEPCRGNYMILLKNIGMLKEYIRNKRLYVYAINKAVWHRSGRVRLHLSGWSEGHHVSEENGGEDVEAVTLDELLDIAEGITLVKMDIEGAEAKVLKETRKFSKVSKISVEVHSNIKDVEGFLRSNGFYVWLFRYPIGSDLVRYWVRTKPKAYSWLIAAYRFTASNLAKPLVTIVKGIKE